MTTFHFDHVFNKTNQQDRMTPMPKRSDMTPLNAFIAREFDEDPSITQEAIAYDAARKFSRTWSRTAIQSRIKQMQKHGILKSGTVVAKWEQVGLPLKFRVDIQINQDALLNPAIGGGPLGIDGKPYP